MSERIWEILYKSHHHLGGIFLMMLVATVLYRTHNNTWNMAKVLKFDFKEASTQSNTRCNYFSGKWVYDNISYPIYKESECSFISGTFACQQIGRGESKYQNWRWKPHHCDLPRFDGKAFLDKLRGKKLLFVGDSLNRNMYESMLCLIEPYLPPFTNKSVTLNTFQIKEYNATISYYWSPFFVESNRDDSRNHSVLNIQRTIRLGAIEKQARVWTDSDILVFNSYAWWLDPKFILLWGAFGSSDAFYKRVEMTTRLYEIALRTWSDWLVMNINRTRTKVFFAGHSPKHHEANIWGGGEGNCEHETEMIVNEEVDWSGLENRDNLMRVAELTFDKLKTRGIKVNYLNITHLSAYRKDAHPSLYRQYRGNTRYVDCLHWCLPGVPDIWNQILYTYITGS